MAGEAATPAGIPYLGSLIALTSVSGQRYRGTLYTVDLNDSTIALQHVTLGADDAPTGVTYDFIKFRGCDIADLVVLPDGRSQEPQLSAPTQQASPAVSDQPAVASQPTAGGGPIAPSAPQVSNWSHPAGPASQPQLQTRLPPPQQQPIGPPASSGAGSGGGGGARAGAPTVMITPAAPPRTAPPPPAQQQPQQKQQQQQQQGLPGLQPGRGRRDDAGPPGRGGRGGGRGPPGRGRNGFARRGGPPPLGRGMPGSAPSRPENVPKTDFDFQAALSKFNKADVQQESAQLDDAEGEDPAPPPSAAKYGKDDFFDELSCEALGRLKISEAAEGGGRPMFDGRARAAEQRKVDMETFGEVHQGRGFSGRRGRGRGRGGGYRGRGDGGRSGRGRGGGRGGGHMPDAMPSPQVAA